jgi:hypothetical protein
LLPFGRLWCDTPDNAIGHAMHSSRSHDAVILVYDAGGNVIETHEHEGRKNLDSLYDPSRNSAKTESYEKTN